MAISVALDVADGLVPVVVGGGGANEEVVRPIFRNYDSASFQIGGLT